MTSLNHNHLLEGPSPGTVILGIGLLQMNGGGGDIIQPMALTELSLVVRIKLNNTSEIP